MSLLARKQLRGTDNLSTPATALIPLLPYLPDVIWEAATGEGQLARSLEAHGRVVLRGYNFFDETFKAEAIVTNPPYRQKDQFLKRCYELGLPFALLMPITALEGIERQRLYKENGIQLLILPKRVDFTGKNAPWFAVAWFTHGLNLPNQLVFAEPRAAVNKMVGA